MTAKPDRPTFIVTLRPERIEIGRAIEERLGERRGRPSEEKVQNFAPFSGTKTRDIAAKPDRPTFIITLRPEPDVDPVQALRAALKRLLRDHGLRCTYIKRQPEARP